ncbi:hypothetical protein [Pseudomonas aeruginosa]|uniref:hypothetical protein n=1 Tax=Pseudomonas aeruginosa TaxID=287 RepID=UPI0031FE94AD
MNLTKLKFCMFQQLAEELVTLARSPMMRRRREKFRAQLEVSHPGLLIEEDDMYLFLPIKAIVITWLQMIRVTQLLGRHRQGR